MPGTESMPSTIQRSPKKAQDIWAKVHDSAVEEYGEGRRAHQTAFAALKHQYEKVGDHWEPKGHKGPSDPGGASRHGKGGETFGGVDYYGHTKEELYERAKDLDIKGRSHMDKKELARAIADKQ